MRRISINLYNIDELSIQAQEQAFKRYRHLFAEDSFWYETEFQYFTELCNSIGVLIDRNGISFSGFHSQGDGSSFTSCVDEIQMVRAIESQAWKEYAPTLELYLDECPCDKRVIELIEKEFIECRCMTEKPNSGYWLDIWFEYHFVPFKENDLPNINHELNKFDKWLRNTLKKLNNFLYRSLEKQYEFITSDENLKESFLDNEWLFTEDGKMADWLLDLAIQ